MPKFEPGDIVRHHPIGPNGISTRHRYKVEAVSYGGIHLWLSRVGSAGPPTTGLAAVYEKVPDFFEVGQTYVWPESGTAFSILAQLTDCREEFTVADVRTRKNGTKVAFGHRVAIRDGKTVADDWTTESRRDFRYTWTLKG